LTTYPTPYSPREKEVALLAAASVYEGQPSPDPGAVLAAASRFLAWVTSARLTLTTAPLTWEQGSPSISTPTQYTAGGKVQLTDTQQVVLSVEPEDSKGQATSDTLTWSSSDTTVISLQPAADTLSCLCVAGVPGTGVTVTVTDGTLSASDNFDVVAGAAASLVITEGTPEAQPPAPPAP
jgi:hypothetical protein